MPHLSGPRWVRGREPGSDNDNHQAEEEALVTDAPEIKFRRQNSHGFRVNQAGHETYVYGRFFRDGGVMVSVFIDGEMVFSDVIKADRTPARRRA
jgi:hypothetical protein